MVHVTTYIVIKRVKSVPSGRLGGNRVRVTPANNNGTVCVVIPKVLAEQFKLSTTVVCEWVVMDVRSALVLTLKKVEGEMGEAV